MRGVQLDDLRWAVAGDEELDVEEACVEPVRGHEHGGQLHAARRSRSGGSADGYSKRSNEFVPGYLTESVTPITVTRPSCTKPSSVTSSPVDELLDEEAADGVLGQTGERRRYAPTPSR